MNLRHHTPPAHGARLPALPLKIRVVTRLTVAIPVVLFGVSAVVYLWRGSREVAAQLTPVLTAELTRQLGHEVRIGRIRYAVPGIITADGISMSAGRTFRERNGEEAVSAHQVVIRYDWRAMVRDPQHALQYVKQIDLDRPYVLIERYSGNLFNFSDLFKPKTKKTKSLFMARIVIHDGRVRFRDYLASPHVAPHLAVNDASSVNALVNFGSDSQVVFSGTGIGRSGNADAFSVAGQASRLVSGRFQVAITARNARIPYWQHYFSAAPAARALGGHADIALTIARISKHDKNILVYGSATVTNASVIAQNRTVLRSPVQNIAGTFQFTGNSVSGNGTATVQGQPFALSGTLYNFKAPHLTATLTSGRIDPARLSVAMPILKMPPGLNAAPGAARVAVTGSMLKPLITAQVAIPAASYNGRAARNIVGTVIVDNGSGVVQDASLDLVGGGRVTGHGAFTTKGGLRYTLAGTASGVNVSPLFIAAAKSPHAAGIGQPHVTGIADAQFIASGAGRVPVITANVFVRNTQVAKTPIGSIAGRVAWRQDGTLHIDRAAVFGPSGDATVEGDVDPRVAGFGMHLAVDAVDIDVDRALRPYGRPDVSGTAYFHGVVSGTASSPQIAGNARVFHPRFGQYNLDTVEGTVSASMDALRFTNVTIHRYPADARLSGTVTALRSGNPVFNLNTTVSGADIHDLLQQATAPQPSGKRPLLSSHKAQTEVAATLPTVTGNADGSFHIGGTFRSPTVTGRIDVTGATVGAYRINSAQTHVAYAHDSASLDDVVIRSGTATITGSGHWKAPAAGRPATEGAVDAIFSGNNVELERFARYTRQVADLHGSINFSGQLSGTLASPAVAFGLVGNDLTFNGQKLAEFTGFGQYENGVVSSTNSPWEFTFSGPLLGAPQTETDAHVKYVIDSFRVALPADPASGEQTKIDVTAHIPADAPERLGHLIETIRQSRLAETKTGADLLARLDKLPRPLDATFYTPPDPAKPEAAMVVPGSAKAEAATDAAPDQAPPAEAVHVSGPLDALHISGGLRVDGLKVGDNAVQTLDLTGSYAPGPVGTVHLTATGIHVASAPVDRLDADAKIDRDLVTVPEVKLTGPTTLVTASGKANLKGDLDATLDASGIPLTALNPWLPSARFAGGEISDLSVTASGATRSPDLTASVDISQPSIAVGPAAPETVAAAANIPASASSVSSTYKLDRIRSGAIRLSTLPGTDVRQLNISDITAYGNGQPVAAMTGTIPFRLTDSGPTLSGVPDSLPVNANLTVKDLSVFSVGAPEIDPKRTGGSLVAALSAQKSGNGRSLMGQVTIQNGSLGFQGIDTALTAIAATAHIDAGAFTLDSLSAQSTRGGTVTANGSMALAGSRSVDAKVAFTGFQINEGSKQNLLARLYNSSVRGKITGSFAVTGPAKSPLIATTAGPVLVTDASAVLPSRGPEDQAAARPLPVDPQFDIQARIGTERKTATVGNALLRADAYGDLSLAGALSAPRVYSHLNVKGGQFILPPSTRIRLVGSNNEVTLNYPRPNPDPTNGPPEVLEIRVNLDAETSVTPSSALLASTVSAVGSTVGQPQQGTSATSADRQQQRYVIHAHISGVLGDPNNQMELTSDPPGLTRAQMLAALGQQDALLALLKGSGTGNVISSEFSQALNVIGVPMLLEPLESSVADALGLSAFTVEYTPDTPIMITLTKPVTKKLSLTYTRSFGAATSTTVNIPTNLQTPLYRIQLDYGLTRRLRIGASTDNVQGNTISLNGLFGF